MLQNCRNEDLGHQDFIPERHLLLLKFQSHADIFISIFVLSQQNTTKSFIIAQILLPDIYIIVESNLSTRSRQLMWNREKCLRVGQKFYN